MNETFETQPLKKINLFSLNRLRLIGYGLLLLWLIDSLHILIPPQLMNPVWELQTIGTFIERVPVPLLGFIFVFWGEYSDRKLLEEFLLKILSWFALILAVIFMLVIPLCIIDGLRVNTLNATRIETQVQQRLSQLQQVQEQVEQSSSNNLRQLAEQIRNTDASFEAEDPELIKSEVLSRLSTTKEQIQNQAKITRSNQRRILLKNSVKWSLGALISSTLFFIIWKNTIWARKFES